MTGTAKTRPAKGAWLSGRGSLAVATAIVLAIVAMGLPVIAQEHPLSAWRLDEWGKWTGLPEVNPYATIAGQGSSQGWGNAGASVGISARAVFEPDLSRAEISAEFVPVSRAIITSDSRLFIAPLGQRLEWKVIVTVRNPNDVPMTNARVHNQFGKAFRAALTGQSVGDARMADADAKGLLPSSSGLTWDIGYLGPRAAAKAELTVTTSQSGGRAEFAEEGVYSLDTGFQLTYRLLGKDEVRNTAPCSVIARRNPSALKSDGEPYGVSQKPIERDLVLPERTIPAGPGPQGPGAGDPGSRQPAVITRVPGGGSQNSSKDITRAKELLSLTAAGVSTNITEDGDRFRVPPGQAAEWNVKLVIENTQDDWWDDWTVTLTFGPGLNVPASGATMLVTDTYGNAVYPGALTLVPQGSGPEATDVTWTWASSVRKFDPGFRAQLELQVKTVGLPGGTAESVFCKSIQMEYDPKTGDSATVHLDDVYIAPPVELYAYVSLSATRLDWRVRKPGTYAAMATEVTATGYGKLIVQFSGFDNLTRADGGDEAIDTSYGFGDSLADVEDAENVTLEQWVPAASLNGQSRGLDLSSSEPAALRMWSKVRVGSEDPSAEYEDYEGGVITFIVSNN